MYIVYILIYKMYSGSKIDMQTYMHNPVKNYGRFLIADNVDDEFDYDHGACAKQIHTSSRILQTGGLASIFSGNQQQGDYILTNIDSLCTFESCVIRLRLTNNDAVNPAILLPSQYMINYYETLLENGQVETVYNHNLFYDNLYLKNSDEEVINNQSLFEFAGGIDGVAYGSGLTIPAGGSATVFIDLPNLFTKTNMFIKAVQKNIGIRVQYHPTGMTSASTSSGISVNDADLLITGLEFDKNVQNKLMDRHREMDCLFSYSEPIRAIVPGQTISATNKSNVKITELSDMKVSQLVVFGVPAGAANEAQFNFVDLSKLDLLRSGKSIGSFQDQPTDFIKTQMNRLFGTSAVSTNNIYVLNFAKNPVLSANKGMATGGVYMTTNDVLEIQAAVAGTYDIYCLAYRYDVITLYKNGNLAVDAVVPL